jgi:hypothetical protein
MITDIINREIQVDDFVVFYSNIYQVKSLGKEHPANSGRGTVRLMIWNGGKTAKPVTKYSKDIAVLDKNHVLLWLLKQGST